MNLDPHLWRKEGNKWILHQELKELKSKNVKFKKTTKPKLILLVGFKILDWLYILIIPIFKKKFKTKFIIICGKSAASKYSEVLDKEDRVMIIDDILNDCSKGYNLDNKIEFK